MHCPKRQMHIESLIIFNYSGQRWMGKHFLRQTTQYVCVSSDYRSRLPVYADDSQSVLFFSTTASLALRVLGGFCSSQSPPALGVGRLVASLSQGQHWNISGNWPSRSHLSRFRVPHSPHVHVFRTVRGRTLAQLIGVKLIKNCTLLQWTCYKTAKETIVDRVRGFPPL